MERDSHGSFSASATALGNSSNRFLNACLQCLEAGDGIEMEKKKVTVEGAFSLGALTLIPVSETTCAGEQIGRTFLLHAAKVPMAVVVISPTERKAFRITGEEISFETLAEEVPEIRREILPYQRFEKSAIV